MKAKRLRKIEVLVSALDPALRAWKEASGLSAILSRRGDANIGSMDASGILIDLLSPVGKESSIAELIEQRGEGMFALNIEVDDLNEAVAELQAKGIPVSEISVGEDGLRGAMIDPASAFGVPIRLLEIE